MAAAAPRHADRHRDRGVGGGRRSTFRSPNSATTDCAEVPVGPDLLAARRSTSTNALRGMRALADEEIAEALLNQRVSRRHREHLEVGDAVGVSRLAIREGGVGRRREAARDRRHRARKLLRQSVDGRPAANRFAVYGRARTAVPPLRDNDRDAATGAGCASDLLVPAVSVTMTRMAIVLPLPLTIQEMRVLQEFRRARGGDDLDPTRSKRSSIRPAAARRQRNRLYPRGF